MNSSNTFLLVAVVKIAAFIFRFLPFRVSLWIARCIGAAGYYFAPTKSAVIYANLKTVFASR